MFRRGLTTSMWCIPCVVFLCLGFAGEVGREDSLYFGSIQQCTKSVGFCAFAKEGDLVSNKILTWMSKPGFMGSVLFRSHLVDHTLDNRPR